MNVATFSKAFRVAITRGNRSEGSLTFSDLKKEGLEREWISSPKWRKRDRGKNKQKLKSEKWMEEKKSAWKAFSFAPWLIHNDRKL